MEVLWFHPSPDAMPPLLATTPSAPRRDMIRYGSQHGTAAPRCRVHGRTAPDGLILRPRSPRPSTSPSLPSATLSIFAPRAIGDGPPRLRGARPTGARHSSEHAGGRAAIHPHARHAPPRPAKRSAGQSSNTGWRGVAGEGRVSHASVGQCRDFCQSYARYTRLPPPIFALFIRSAQSSHVRPHAPSLSHRHTQTTHTYTPYTLTQLRVVGEGDARRSRRAARALQAREAASAFAAICNTRAHRTS